MDVTVRYQGHNDAFVVQVSGMLVKPLSVDYSYEEFSISDSYKSMLLFDYEKIPINYGMMVPAHQFHENIGEINEEFVARVLLDSIIKECAPLFDGFVNIFEPYVYTLVNKFVTLLQGRGTPIDRKATIAKAEKVMAWWKEVAGPDEENPYPSTSNIPTLSERVPALQNWIDFPCSCDDVEGERRLRDTLKNAVIHLNDYCGWSREQIADWMESLDLDLEVKDA